MSSKKKRITVYKKGDIKILILGLVIVAVGIFDIIKINEKKLIAVVPAAKIISSKEIVHGDTTKKQVIFTFDGGAGMQSGERILAVLEKHKVKGTFFLTGRFIEANPLFVAEIAGAGYEIFNHTYDHPHLPTMTDSEIAAELNKMNYLLVSTLASTTARKNKSNAASVAASDDLRSADVSAKPFFRPPYGDRDERVKEVAAKDGYQDVYWTVDADDWEESTGQTADGVTNRIIENLQPGNIYLMHLGDNITGQILDNVFTTIEGKGYKIVSLTQGL